MSFFNNNSNNSNKNNNNKPVFGAGTWGTPSTSQQPSSSGFTSNNTNTNKNPFASPTSSSLNPFAQPFLQSSFNNNNNNGPQPVVVQEAQSSSTVHHNPFAVIAPPPPPVAAISGGGGGGGGSGGFGSSANMTFGSSINSSNSNNLTFGSVTSANKSLSAFGGSNNNSNDSNLGSSFSAFGQPSTFGSSNNGGSASFGGKLTEVFGVTTDDNAQMDDDDDDEGNEKPEDKIARLKAKIAEKKAKLAQAKASAQTWRKEKEKKGSNNPLLSGALSSGRNNDEGTNNDLSKSAKLNKVTKARAAAAAWRAEKESDSLFKKREIITPSRPRSAISPTLKEENTTNSKSKVMVPECSTMCPVNEVADRLQHNEVSFLERPHPAVHPAHMLQLLGQCNFGDYVSLESNPKYLEVLKTTMVKRFRRSAADVDLSIPSEVRTVEALELTMDYLEEFVMERDRQGVDPRFRGEDVSTIPLEVYQYLWNRTRMIRKDFILQNIPKLTDTEENTSTENKSSLHDVDNWEKYLEKLNAAIRVHERIVRWHLLCEDQLCQEEEWKKQSSQNMVECGAALKSLNLLYEERRALLQSNHTVKLKVRSYKTCVNGSSPVDFNGETLNNNMVESQGSCETNEAEMRALYLLLILPQNHGLDVKNNLKVMPKDLLFTKEIQLALKYIKAIRGGGYYTFFQLLREGPYLFACAVLKYVEQMRKRAIYYMNRVYISKGAEGGYPLSKLVDVLAFQDEDEATETLTFYGISYKDGIIQFAISEPVSEGRCSPKKLMFLEEKLHLYPANTRLHICRGYLSSYGFESSEDAEHFQRMKQEREEQMQKERMRIEMQRKIQLEEKQKLEHQKALELEMQKAKEQERLRIIEEQEKIKLQQMVILQRAEEERKLQEQSAKKAEARRLALEQEARERKLAEKKRLEEEARIAAENARLEEERRKEEERLKAQREAERKAREEAEREKRRIEILRAQEERRRLQMQRQAEEEYKLEKVRKEKEIKSSLINFYFKKWMYHEHCAEFRRICKTRERLYSVGPVENVSRTVRPSLNKSTRPWSRIGNLFRALTKQDSGEFLDRLEIPPEIESEEAVHMFKISLVLPDFDDTSFSVDVIVNWLDSRLSLDYIFSISTNVRIIWVVAETVEDIVGSDAVMFIIPPRTSRTRHCEFPASLVRFASTEISLNACLRMSARGSAMDETVVQCLKNKGVEFAFIVETNLDNDSPDLLLQSLCLDVVNVLLKHNGKMVNQCHGSVLFRSILKRYLSFSDAKSPREFVALVETTIDILLEELSRLENNVNRSTYSYFPAIDFTKKGDREELVIEGYFKEFGEDDARAMLPLQWQSRLSEKAFLKKALSSEYNPLFFAGSATSDEYLKKSFMSLIASSTPFEQQKLEKAYDTNDFLSIVQLVSDRANRARNIESKEDFLSRVCYFPKGAIGAVIEKTTLKVIEAMILKTKLSSGKRKNFSCRTPPRTMNLAKALQDLDQRNSSYIDSKDDVIDEWFTTVHDDHYYENFQRARKSSSSSTFEKQNSPKKKAKTSTPIITEATSIAGEVKETSTFNDDERTFLQYIGVL